MTDFAQALKKTLAYEGGHVNHPSDPGGETFCGISRKHHPDWAGWAILAAIPDKKNIFPGSRSQLDAIAANFYRKNYWDRLRCGEMGQTVAGELFDCAVNCGCQRAAGFLQAALNLLNADGRLFDALAVDGAIGAETLAAYGRVKDKGWEDDVVRVLKALRAEHYVGICRRAPSQRVFLRGWLNRVFSHG